MEASQIQAVRDWVGSKPVDADIEAHFDDLGDVNRVALRILRQRLADWLRNPVSFGTEEGYRENRKANIDQVKDQIARLEILIGDDESTSLMTVGRVQRFDDEDRGWPVSTTLV